MTRAQLDLIPDGCLKSRDTTRLLAWLHARGWRMTLLEVHEERTRRGFASDLTKHTGTWIPRAKKEN